MDKSRATWWRAVCKISVFSWQLSQDSSRNVQNKQEAYPSSLVEL